MSAEPTTSVEDPTPGAFDVRDFARTAVGSHRSTIDLEAFETTPLDDGTVRVLAYLRELERQTMTYLRNVLVTPTHKDARVTAFLTTWAYEKFWIADAFEVIVRAHGVDPTEPQKLSTLRALGLEIAERATPIVESFRANAIGPDVIGVHLATVAVDEWIIDAAYGRLATLDPHPQLVALLERVTEVKARHRVFVEAETLRRLRDSARARSLARRSLRRTAWPIGAASTERSETAFFYESLIDGPAAQLVDDRVRALPGLAPLHLVQTARTAALRGGGGSALGTRLGRALASAKNTIAPGARASSTTRSDTKDGTHG